MYPSPLLSIVIPLFNRELLIQATLCSISNQTYPNWEVIIIDDGSTDASEIIVQKYSKSDSRIKYLKRISNPKGAQHCRNIGIEKANGDYIMFLDSDDILAPYCIEQRVNFMIQNPELDFTVFPQLIFNEIPGDNNILINIPTKNKDINRFFSLGYYLDVPWINSGPIFKRESLFKYNIHWNEELRGFQDVAFHLDCLIAGMKYKYADCKPDFYYRMHAGARIGSAIFSPQTLISTELMLLKYHQTLKKLNLLDKTLHADIVRSFFHSVIKKWMERGNYEAANSSLRTLKNKEIVSLVLFIQILLYILLRKRGMVKGLVEKSYYKMWEKNILKISSGNYLKHKYIKPDNA